MIIPLRWRVLWLNTDPGEGYYQEMYVTREQYDEMVNSKNGLNDVTGQDDHEEKFKRIKNAVKEKLK